MLELNSFVDRHMKKGDNYVPARLQAALALLEKLREKPSLNLRDHLASKGGSGLESHETFGNRAHERYEIEPINKNHGRRSCQLQDWGQDLLDILKVNEFNTKSKTTRTKLINSAQASIARLLRGILEQEPLRVKSRGRSAEAVIKEVLRQAEFKSKSGEASQYLVGAKLRLRFGPDIKIYAANKGDRRSRSDRRARKGDYEIDGTVIEVAIGLPDEKHLSQIVDVLDSPDSEVWLLTREDRVATWRNELAKLEDIDTRRVVIASVEGFVGQNISELAAFSPKNKCSKLQELFDLYNHDFVASLGPPGIRIEVK